MRFGPAPSRPRSGPARPRSAIEKCRIVACACVLLGCGRVGFDTRSDAEIARDAPPTSCGPWALPQPVPGLEDTTASAPSLTGDLLHIYYDDNITAIWVASRENPTASFGAPTLISGIETAAIERDPEVSSDGSRLFFVRASSGMHVADRTSASRDSFGPGTLVDTSASNPAASPDGRTVWVDEFPVRRFEQQGSTWLDAGFESGELAPGAAISFTADRRTIVFESTRGSGSFEVWSAKRVDAMLPFDAPQIVDEIAGVGANEPWISGDGTALYFSVDGPARIHYTTRTCR